MISLQSAKIFLNKDIFLNKNDKDVVIYFKVNGFPYKFSNNTEDSIDGAVYSQIILQKPTGEVILLPKTAVDGDKIILKIKRCVWIIVNLHLDYWSVFFLVLF